MHFNGRACPAVFVFPRQGFFCALSVPGKFLGGSGVILARNCLWNRPRFILN